MFIRALLAFAPYLLTRAWETTPDPDPDPDPDPKPGDDGKFTQADLDRIVKRAKRDAASAERDRLKAETERDRKKAEDDAEAERLKKAGEFDKLQADLEKRASDAEANATQASTERDILLPWFEARYEAALKDLPELVLALKPADDASLATKVDWLTKAQEAADKDAESGGPTRRAGHGPNPKPTAPKGLSDDDARAQARQRVRI